MSSNRNPFALKTLSIGTAIAAALAPNPYDEYTMEQKLRISLILRIDSYKFSHPYAFPTNEDIRGMTSYGTARIKPTETVIPFGMQRFIKQYLTERITMADVDAAEQFSELHFGRKLFARAAWERVVTEFDGLLPIVIRSIPEGTPIRGGEPLYTVTVIDESPVNNLFFLSAGFETIIQRGVWYPTTIATMDYNIKADIKRFYDIAGCGYDMLPFALHDFGGRGVTSAESAEIGGMAHTVNFMGSDTVEGILNANFFYKEQMAAFSVYATEHSIECSFGPTRENAIEYLTHQINTAKSLGIQVLSIVLDGYDVYREAGLLCNELKNLIVESGIKVVFRPDSGDMMEVVPRLLKMQEAAFGYTVTKNGYKKINNVGIIQGDGVNHMAIRTLLGNIMAMNFSPDCVLFGSGGALLQKLDRDTMKFAQKACAKMVVNADGSTRWIGIAKDPVTDQGKKSKEGFLTLIRNSQTGETKVIDLVREEIADGWTDVMKIVYANGRLYNETTLAEVRARVDSSVI